MKTHWILILLTISTLFLLPALAQKDRDNARIDVRSELANEVREDAMNDAKSDDKQGWFLLYFD